MKTQSAAGNPPTGVGGLFSSRLHTRTVMDHGAFISSARLAGREAGGSSERDEGRCFLPGRPGMNDPPTAVAGIRRDRLFTRSR